MAAYYPISRVNLKQWLRYNLRVMLVILLTILALCILPLIDTDAIFPSWAGKVIIWLLVVEFLILMFLKLRRKIRRKDCARGRDCLDKGDYDQSLKIFTSLTRRNPDNPDYHLALGLTRLELACNRAGENAETLRLQAETSLHNAQLIEPGLAAYALARLAGQGNDEAQCRHWLEMPESKKYLPPCEHALTDPDLASMRDKDWFQAIRWKGEQ